MGREDRGRGRSRNNSGPSRGHPRRDPSRRLRALPPLQKSLIVYAEKRDCYSCHNQGVPLVALAIARSRGLAIDEDVFEGAVSLTRADLESGLERYRKGRGQPGGATRAAYALWTLEVGRPPARQGHCRGGGIPAEGRSRSRPLDDLGPAHADGGQPLHHDRAGAPGA